MVCVKYTVGIMMMGFLGTAVCAAESLQSRKLLGCVFGLFCDDEDKKCPPKGFGSVSDFDLDAYISAPWYVQQQMPLLYQPESQLFCVRASYEKVDEDDLSKGIKVYNYANKDKVNGEAVGTSGSGDGSSGFFGELRAIVPDESVPSKLEVGPAFFKDVFGTKVAETFYGPYWVVAVGESEDPELGYDWAIISGGPPKQEADEGCRTGSRFLTKFQVNGAGFWLFSRKPVDPENTKIMREVAKDLGFDLSVLKDVEQEGCEYEGAL